ncbi:RagB/SusD family nutrient uptake outer membrane protein [Marinilabilia rubra]|uniref:RagB/SusD family nutrient uptake outer membrane protein n=1 Tax=Marinilabilia rubra TaxID=2162893 RepID=A0A2U2B8F7_9BACT|nr:RagB/SusD family nutrient uptake outer membrane protein [Marinilabilia rubra]PWD99350.1 hypothetical protein DDZ16_10080 [Marinilabilia rubra]
MYSKNIVNFVLILFLILFSSCSDFLEEDPKSFYSTTNFYSSEKNIEIAVSGCYDALGATGQPTVYGSYFHGLRFVGVVGTDELMTNAGLKNVNFIAPSNYSHTSESLMIKEIWKNQYLGIESCNLVIDKIEGVAFESQELKERLLGEAYFLRGFYYLHLVRLYGPVPLNLTPTVSLDLINVPRSSLQEVYTQIVSDMEKATELLWEDVPEGDNGRISKYAAKAILSNVYLTMASLAEHKPYEGLDLNGVDMSWVNTSEFYQEAADLAMEVISSTKYDLLSASVSEDYGQIFSHNNEYNKEILFDVQFISGTTEGGAVAGNYGYENSYGNTAQNSGAYQIAKPVGDFVYRFQQKSLQDGDIRYAWNCASTRIVKSGAVGGQKSYQDFGATKWQKPDAPGFNIYDSPINFPLMRYAEVLLTFAEANARAKGSVDAESLEMMNRVRRRALGLDYTIADVSADYTNTDLDAFLEQIFIERSFELCWEGKRWYDLVRTNKLISTIKETSTFHQYTLKSVDDKMLLEAQKNILPHHVLFPIPKNELSTNPLLTQNPGYL